MTNFSWEKTQNIDSRKKRIVCLILGKCLSYSVLFCSLTEVIQYAEDMEIDIPKIWQYFGELIGPMVQDGSVPLNFLRKAAEPLKENNKAGLLVAEVLHAASHREVCFVTILLLKFSVFFFNNIILQMQLMMSHYLL